MSKKYSKDSFDRFGDDLSQLLLNYLSFEQKVVFECVSKQWQRLVFSRQLRFELLRHKFSAKDNCNELFVRCFVHQNQTFQLNPQLFESLLKKFWTLNQLLIDNNCKCDEQVLKVLTLLSQNCLSNLQSIEMRVKEDINEEVLNEFCSHFGQRLTHVSIAGLSDTKLAAVLSHFGQNLRSIDLKQNLRSLLIAFDLHFNNKLVLNKLQKVFLTNPSTQEFEDFVHRCGQQIRELSLSFDQHYRHNIKTTLKLVSNLPNLQILRLDSELFFLKQNDIEFTEEQHIIDESLALIGHKCLRLHSIDICIFGDLISDGFLKTFGRHYHCLQRLDIALWDIGDKRFTTDNCFSFGPKNGIHLTKLNLMFERLSDDYLKDIHLYLPNLKAVKLNSDEPLTDNCLSYLSKLSKLQTLVLEGNIDINYLTIDGIIQLITSCYQTLHIIDIEFENDFNEISYDLFIITANIWPKINFYISFHDYDDRHQDICVYSNPKNNLHVFKI